MICHFSWVIITFRHNKNFLLFHKRLKFCHADKRYMHKPESVLENVTHKILWDFEVQTDPKIQVRKPDLISRT